MWAKDSSLWLGTWGEGLNHFKHGTDKFKRYKHKKNDKNSISSNHISVITETNDGYLWIGTQDGLDRLHIKTGEIKRFKHERSNSRSLDCNLVRALHVDKSGTLWVGTGFPYFDNNEGGLLKYDPATESFTRYLPEKNNPSSLLSNYVRAIAEDSKGRLWVGSSEGLQLFDPNSGTFSMPPVGVRFKERQKNNLSHLTFFFEDNQKCLWTGDFGAGLLCVDPSTGERIFFNSKLLTPSKRRLLDNAAWTMFQSNDGVLWLSTANVKSRVYRIRERGRLLPKTPNRNIEPLPNANAHLEIPPVNVADRLGDISIYNENGDNGTVEVRTDIENPADAQEELTEVADQEFHTDGVLWIVENNANGVLLKKDTRTGATKNYTLETAATKAGEWKSSPIEDLNENHWVCLENGLLKLDARKRKGIFYDAKKLGGKPPFKGMVMDGRGTLWVLGQSLLKFEPENERAFSFEKGTAETKLPVSADNISCDENGDIVLLTDEGVHTFNPGAWADSTYAPKLRITDFELLDLEDQAEFDSSQQAAFWETDFLVLDHFQNAFFISFAVLDFQSPELHKLEYKLENHDKNWRHAEGDPKAIYANVPPGKYTFKVRGANQFGIWGHEAELGMVIEAPWWKTWIAYVAYGLLALLLIYFIYRYELNKRLAESETLRLQELHDTKSRLYTNITHEFRTPLTIIMGMAQQIKENPKSHLDNGLNLIHKNGQQLLNLVNQLLDLSKVEDGKMVLKSIEGDVVLFFKKQVEGMKSFAADKGIGLHFIPEMGNLDMEYDPQKLQRVTANILSNAIKFTPQRRQRLHQPQCQ